MDPLAWTVLISCIAGIGCSSLGAGIATLFKAGSNRTASLLLSFAAGLMLSIICFDFLPEAMELEGSPIHLAKVVVTVAAGAVVVGVLDKVVDSLGQKRAHCCALDDPLIADVLDEGIRNEHMKHHDDIRAHHPNHDGHVTAGAAASKDPSGARGSNLRVAGWVMAAAISMHNLPAGMSIGGSFASPEGTMIASGVMVAALLGLHSIPEAMSMAVPLTSSGLSKGKTVLLGACVGAFLVVGALLGYAIGEIGMFWMAMSLAFASGAMLYVLFGEILPEAFLLFHSKKPAIATLTGLVLGFMLISL